MKKLTKVLVAMTIVGTSTFAKAEMLAGKNFVGGGLGLVDYDYDNGYYDSDLDNGVELNFLANFRLNQNLDMNFNVAYGWADSSRYKYENEFSTLELLGGVDYYFKPNNKFNPYAGGGLQIVRWAWELTGRDGLDREVKYDDDDIEVGLYVEGGIEIEFLPALFTRFGGALYTADGFDGVEAEAMVGYRFAPDLLGTVIGRHGLSNDRPDRVMFGMIFKT